MLVEGRAIKLHPLACTAFNADFDGDQMAVHLPLGEDACREAKMLMLASGNLLKPSDGAPVTVPTQDMILGSYYLTTVRENEEGAGKVFRDENEALMAYAEHVVTLHAPIKCAAPWSSTAWSAPVWWTPPSAASSSTTPCLRIWLYRPHRP